MDTVDLPPSARSLREILRSYQLPRTLHEAQIYLSRLSLSLHMLSVYQHFFPEEYAHSTERIFPQDNEAYSPREAQFLALVDERLFPIYIDYLLGSETADERSNAIPACPLGRSIWEEDLSELPPIWQLAFFLAGEVSVDEFDAVLPELEVPGDSPLHGAEWQYINWDTFCQEWQRCIENVHPSLSIVPLTIRMGIHDTQNAFLDPTDETPLDDFFWYLEDVQILVEHYQEAERILGQVENLLKWLQEDSSHLGELLSHMSTCLYIAHHKNSDEKPDLGKEEIDD